MQPREKSILAERRALPQTLALIEKRRRICKTAQLRQVKIAGGQQGWVGPSKMRG